MMELRTLTSKDIFSICGILKKIGIKEFKEAFNNSVELADTCKDKKNLDALLGVNTVFEIASIIISNIPSCEREIYTFVASVIKDDDVGMKELMEMPMADFANIIADIIAKQEFKDFFKVALKFFK